MMEVKFYRMHEDVSVPKFATDESACLDLKCFFHKDTVVSYGPDNVKRDLPVVEGRVILPAGSRTLLPTGIILDIPLGYSMRIHPRSGTSLKLGLTMVNCEGIVDSDYTEEILIPIHNTSSTMVEVVHGDRYAQAEFVKSDGHVFFIERSSPIPQKTDRNGGFGSTGVS